VKREAAEVRETRWQLPLLTVPRYAARFSSVRAVPESMRIASIAAQCSRRIAAP
jgi:hypothetical protein